MAPEIFLRQPYQPRPVDIFDLAIILFTMVAQHPPFTYPRPDDTYYKCIASNRSDLYWRLVSKGRAPGFFSNEFKELITSMLQLDPVHRPTMSELYKHPWTCAEMPTEEEVK